MQNPINSQSSMIKAILVSIAAMIIGTILLYFLKFFGLTLKATLQKSIAVASNSELYTNILLILVICLLSLTAFTITSLFLRRKEAKANLNNQSNDEKKTNKGNDFEPQLNRYVLDDTAVNIFLRLWKFPDGLTDKAISKILELDIQTVKYHLEKLEQQGMVHGTLAAGQPRIWRLIQGGREYLIENKLIS